MEKFRISPLRRSMDHLEESEMGYWPHLRHAFHQSNRLIVIALKSYIHGLFPVWFKADGPRAIIRIYHEIRRIRHIDKIAENMEKNELPEQRSKDI